MVEETKDKDANVREVKELIREPVRGSALDLEPAAQSITASAQQALQSSDSSSENEEIEGASGFD